MASSGQVTLSTQSVDYNYGGPYTRGAVTLTNVIGWNVNDSADISFNLISSSDNAGGTWGICTSGPGYYIKLIPQVSYDGGANWNDLDVKQHWVSEVCGQGYTNTISMSTTLINSLGSYHLTGNCMLRFLYFMTVAPAPDASFPHAFPNEGYSEAVQVPVHIDVNWEAKLIYDANGGSGAPSAQTASVPSATTSHNFTIPNTAPTWGDYIFLGWSRTQHSGSCTPADVEYVAGDTFTVEKTNPTRTLYAVWMKDYRPGAVRVSGDWKSTNRTGGKCHLLSNGSWVEMRTIDGGSGTGNPPSRRTSGAWKNQYKIGSS